MAWKRWVGGSIPPRATLKPLWLWAVARSVRGTDASIADIAVHVLLRQGESFYAVEWSQVQDGVGVWLSTADQRMVAAGGLEGIR